MLNIITLDYFLTGDGITNIDVDGEETLLDADLVIIDPSDFSHLWSKQSTEHNDGTYVFSPTSDKIRSLFYTRKAEIETLLENGKMIIVFTCPLELFKGQVNNNSKYEWVTNYDLFPSHERLILNLKNGKGSGSNSIVLKDQTNIFVPYYKAFKEELNYSVYLDNTGSDKELNFLTNRSNKPVGFTFKVNKGIIAFLPPPKFIKDNKKLTNILISCANKFLKNKEASPPPIWIKKSFLPGELEFDTKIAAIQDEIKKLEARKINLVNQKTNITQFKNLLFEQGQELENIVIEAFRLFGFNAENRKMNDLEHDIVFKSQEGKGIAELEGKDNDAINISKFDQLNRAVDEDFDLTNEYPQGVLIGNHYRLLEPGLRKAPFTDKVLTVATKRNFGLLTTLEIYNAVEKILKDPEDEVFKKSCRDKILKTEGSIIKLI